MSNNVALVIGNGDYRHGSKLASPRHDAREIGRALERLNFSVIEGNDLDLRGFRKAIGEFLAAMDGAEAAAFFYAGLALHYRARNFLIPVDADRVSKRHLFEAVELEPILADMAQVRGPKFVFLDAARSSPFTRDFDSADAFDGVDIRPETNMLVGMSAKPRATASDSMDRRSVFVAALLHALERPVLSVPDMISEVQERVTTLTEGRQIPLFRSTLQTNLPWVRESRALAQMTRAPDESDIRAFQVRMPGHTSRELSGNVSGSKWLDPSLQKLKKLTQATMESAEALSTVRAMLSRRKSQLERSALRLWGLSPRREVVDCAVFAPRAAAVGRWISVQVFLHKPERRAEGQQLATLIDPTTAMVGISTLEVRVARGTRVTIRLEIPGAEVEDNVQTLVWQGATQGRSFFVSLPANVDGEELRAKARFYVEGCPVGWIGFTLRRGQTTDASALVPRGDRARRYTYAFISYASEDRSEVKKRTQALRAARIGYFHDILSLDPGDRWAHRLYEEIDRCDLFMLFWSRAASESKWVTREIERAMQRRSVSPEELPDIAPIALEPTSKAPRPTTLSEFHFDSSTT